MQLGIDVTCIHTNFGWCDPSGFRDMATIFWLISLHTNTAIALMIYMYMFVFFTNYCLGRRGQWLLYSYAC